MVVYPTIDKVKTGKRIKLLMAERNVTVKNVREYLSLESTQSIYYWLSGKNLPTIDNLYALSELLQVPVDTMLYGNRRYCFPSPQNSYPARIQFYYEQSSNHVWYEVIHNKLC